MKTVCEEITELKVVHVDVDKEFVYFDKLTNGQWRCTMTKSMKDRFIIEERKS